MFGEWLLPHFCWGIWKERNNRIFREKEEPTVVVERKIHKLLKENYQVSKGDDTAKEEVNRKQTNSKRQEASWLLPPEGWFKANFDGASKGNPGPSGCGGVIQNFYGECQVAFSMPIGTQTNHVAEARAACESVKIATEMGVKNLWLEGDSKNILDCIQGKTQPSWTILNIIEETKENLKKFEKIHITHIFREANPMADWLANDGVR
jgi:ribonuclease HI